MSELGKRLRLARELRNMTQGQLAEKSGVKQGSISKIERGDQDRTTFCLELAEALNVNRDWLETGRGEIEIPAAVNERLAGYNVPDHEAEVKVLIDEMRDLDRNEFAAILDIVKAVKRLRDRNDS